jgi:hypothetical protein
LPSVVQQTQTRTQQLTLPSSFAFLSWIRAVLRQPQLGCLLLCLQAFLCVFPWRAWVPWGFISSLLISWSASTDSYPCKIT